jgi:hypothetical protein
MPSLLSRQFDFANHWPINQTCSWSLIQLASCQGLLAFMKFMLSKSLVDYLQSWLSTLLLHHAIAFSLSAISLHMLSQIEWSISHAYGHILIANFIDSLTLLAIFLALLAVYMSISTLISIINNYTRHYFYSKSYTTIKFLLQRPQDYCTWKVFVSHIKIQWLKNPNHSVPYQPINISLT